MSWNYHFNFKGRQIQHSFEFEIIIEHQVYNHFDNIRSGKVGTWGISLRHEHQFQKPWKEFFTLTMNLLETSLKLFLIFLHKLSKELLRFIWRQFLFTCNILLQEPHPHCQDFLEHKITADALNPVSQVFPSPKLNQIFLSPCPITPQNIIQQMSIISTTHLIRRTWWK